MYKSSSHSYYVSKYLLPVISLILILIVGWSLISPNATINDNGINRAFELSDSFYFLSFALMGVLYYVLVSSRLIRIKLNNNYLEFKFKNETFVKEWADIEKIRQLWAVAPQCI